MAIKISASKRYKFGLGAILAVTGLVISSGLVFAEEIKLTKPVQIESGLLQGKIEGQVKIYAGIPYAAPPVDQWRWREPQPVKPWQGLRQATKFSPVCRQTAPWMQEPQSEDCLYLNIWAPLQTQKKLPVMVWIHGGGLFGGSGSQANYSGEMLVTKGVILVTLNYRLGVLGFFAHPDLAEETKGQLLGNQGILDQIAALNWVKRNISAFGGDPKNVTIFGESAGAESVAVLLMSPAAKGLFHRAIAQSGNYMVPLNAAESGLYDLTRAQQKAQAFGQTLGAASLIKLRQLKTEQLLAQPWSPWTLSDQKVVVGDMLSLYQQGAQNTVPLLLGWNADEGRDLAPEILATGEFKLSNYQMLMQKMLGRELSPAMRGAYIAQDDSQAKAVIDRFTSDYWGWRMWKWASWHRQNQGQNAYLYYYVHSPAEPLTPCGYGCNAGHGAEIPFVFNLLKQDPRHWRAQDKLLAEQMLSYWTNFAKSGNPNQQGLSNWSVFDGSDASVKKLGDSSEVEARGQLPNFSLFE